MFNIETNTYRGQGTRTKSVPTQICNLERKSENYISNNTDESKHKWEIVHETSDHIEREDKFCNTTQWVHSPSLWSVMPESEVCDIKDGNLQTHALYFDDDDITETDTLNNLENTCHEDCSVRRNAERANCEYEVRTPAHLPPLYPVYTHSEQVNSRSNDNNDDNNKMHLHTQHCYRSDDGTCSADGNSSFYESSLSFYYDANVQSESITHAEELIDEEQLYRTDVDQKRASKENCDNTSNENASTTLLNGNNMYDCTHYKEDKDNLHHDTSCSVTDAITTTAPTTRRNNELELNKRNDEVEKINMRREITQLRAKLEEQAREYEMEVKSRICEITRKVRLDERKIREEFQRVLDMLRDENAQLQAALEQRCRTCSHSSPLIALIENNNQNRSESNTTEGVNNSVSVNSDCVECTQIEAKCKRELHEVEKYWQGRLANAQERLSVEVELHTRQRNELEREVRHINHALQQQREQLEHQLLENTLLKAEKEECTRHHVHSDEVQRWRTKVKELERKVLLLTTQQDTHLHTSASTKCIHTSDTLCNNGISNSDDDEDVVYFENENQVHATEENTKLEELILQKEKELDEERKRCAHLITLYGAQLATLHAELKRTTHRELDAHNTT